ncbi:MAG TPA: gamma carbonic anhydrase family protein [Polyangiaceae bacterium]|nr:gamma carbonic anhydrase family protein [Polyangiaceae bacterium]
MALIIPFGGKTPRVAPSAFVAENATLIGDVEIGEDASVWFGCVLRGDVGPIRVGARTNIQDLCCVHVTGGLSETRVGADVTVGHGAVLHGCVVEDGCLIGMGSIVLDNARVGENSVVGAGSLVTAGKAFPPGSMVMGRPAKLVRPATEAEMRLGREGAFGYVELARHYPRR